MTRILSYNILIGATRRVNQLTKIVQPVQPDIVGLVEATNPKVVEELAKRLNMQAVMTGQAAHLRDWQIALLTRLPIREIQIHTPETLTKPLLEVCLEEGDGQRLTVFVTHLTAVFNRGRAGEHIRRREVETILDIMSTKQGTPHVLMGDFNAIAPRDRLKASNLLRYILRMERRRYENPLATFGHPDLNFVVPPHLRIFNLILRLIPQNKLLCYLFDVAASLYAPRSSIALLLRSGYIDCFRRLNPNALGFTCPAAIPAGRIDFIFASLELAERLSACTIITEGEDVQCADASDHLAVYADFV